jgi:transaldolase
VLNKENAMAEGDEAVSYLKDESKFRWALFNDQMAFDKLHEGIRGFAADGETVKATLRSKLLA